MRSYAYVGTDGFAERVAPRLEEAGFARAHDVLAADAVITYHTSASALEDAYFGDEGLVQMLSPGTLLVDLSAATPNFAREMNAIATLSDLAFVEAPLMVKDMAAEDAFARENMRCFVAGEEDALANARPLLDALFCDVEIVGAAGTAQLAHAADTLQSVAGIVSAIEARSLFTASRRSLSNREMDGMQVQPTSPGALSVLQAVDGDRFTGGFTCEMLMAKLTAAIMAADDYELIMPQAESAMHLLELLSVIGGSDMSPAALALVYEGDEQNCADHGLDWSRADVLYGHDGEGDGADGFDFDDGFDDDDADMGFGYSIN